MANRIRYLAIMLLVALYGGMGLKAQDFNPNNPPEPGQPPTKLTLYVVPAEGGTVSGAGKYTPSSTANVRATAKSGFVFLNWTDANGNVVSTNASYSFNKGQNDETLTANFGYSPSNPAEPTEIAKNVYYYLKLVAEEGGSVSGGGRYLPDRSVRISASCNTGFTFAGWYTQSGTLLSTSASYNYTTTTANTQLTARFNYDPNNPGEPSQPNLRPKHYVTATATEGGTVNIGSKRLMEGETVTLSATKNTGYDFTGWYLNGTLYTANYTFTYTMGTADANFEARFKFNPSSPSEPAMPTAKQYAFYLLNKIGKPGDTIEYPLYLTALTQAGDMTFQLTFPQEMPPQGNTVMLSNKADGYDLAFTATTDTTYTVNLTGGQTPAGNTVLLSFTIKIPDNFPTGESRQVKINQVSVADANGDTFAASTRNGRVSVFKRGDTNGDNVVNSSDVLNMVTRVLDQKTEIFIEEVSDMNDDHSFNSADVLGVVQIVLGN